MALCSLTEATNTELKKFGVDLDSLQTKLDTLAKESNQNIDLLGMPIVSKMLKDFTDAVNATGTGALSEITNSLSASIKAPVAMVGGMLALVTMIASAGTQANLLLISQLRRELVVRITIFKLLTSHYSKILQVLKLLRTPQSVTYRKLLAVLPYVKKAEYQFNKVIQAQAIGELPPRYNYRVLRNAFLNIQQAIKLLSADGNEGGRALGKAIVNSSTGRPVPKRQWQNIGQAIAKDLVFKSVAQSLSYLEALSWHYMRLATLVPIPFEVSDSIYKPNNYTEQFLKSNGVIAADIQRFNSTEEDIALQNLKQNILDVENAPLVARGSDIVKSADLLKGMIPTNVVIDSLISAIVNFPTFNEELTSATQNLMITLTPLSSTIKTVREGMEGSLASQDSDIVVAAKEAIWVTKLNTVFSLRDGVLPAFEGQANLNSDVAAINYLVEYLKQNPDPFVVAKKVPGFIVQNLEVLRAPFSRRSLEESIITVTFVIQQLQKAIQKDYEVLSMVGTSEPILQFRELLKAANNLPAPISTVSKALMSGQIQEMLGFISSISLGSIDSIMSLFDCPNITKKEDETCRDFDDLQDSIISYLS